MNVSINQLLQSAIEYERAVLNDWQPTSLEHLERVLEAREHGDVQSIIDETSCIGGVCTLQWSPNHA